MAEKKTKVPEQQEILDIVGQREQLLIAKAKDEENLIDLKSCQLPGLSSINLSFL